ncbi:hypothetical protein DASC09_061960 [Saccharomycopsis crataegensis]|uniref:Uncharacterized protein n=1 Tax=Saccharomycopsis crataegensis TaxID=43959 RepID=A0AAV5QWQ2_9ASCO|nr:hypothetical protein DASC09_061960 [Saccharomycopsis crataegensis]
MGASVIREDLVVKYTHVPPEARNPATGMMAQTMPMASMFMRNKMMSWASFCICVQHYMNFRNVKLSEDANSPLMSLILATIGLVTAYIDILVPTPQIKKKAAETVADAVTSVVATAVETATGI